MKKFSLLLMFFTAVSVKAQMTRVDSLTIVRSNLEAAYDYLNVSKEYISDVKTLNLLESLGMQISKLNEDISAEIPAEASPNLGGGDMEEKGLPSEEATEEVLENKMDDEEINVVDDTEYIKEENNNSKNPFEKKGYNFYFDFGINTLLGGGNLEKDAELSTGGSWFFTYSLMKKFVNTKSFDMSFGLGYHCNRFKITNDAVLVENGDNSKFAVQTGIAKDPRLSLRYLTLPVLADIGLGRKGHLYLGVTPGYRVSVEQEVNRKAGSERIEESRSSSYGLNKWMVAGKVGLGYRRFDIFGQYNFTNVFNTKNVYNNNILAFGTMIKL